MTYGSRFRGELTSLPGGRELLKSARANVAWMTRHRMSDNAAGGANTSTGIYVKRKAGDALRAHV